MGQIILFDRAVIEFYSLIALELVPRPVALPSQLRLQAEFVRVVPAFEEKLAVAIRDYLTLACFGEARHGEHAANQFLLYGPKRGEGRTGARELARKFEPQSLLTACLGLFSRDGWNSAYGGAKWAHIAECALQWWELPPREFIDCVVNLTHNGGVAFNKNDYGIFHIYDTSTLLEFLNYKRKAETPESLLAFSHGYLHPESLARRLLYSLRLVSPYTVYYGATQNVEEVVLAYSPFRWGSVVFDPTIETRRPQRSQRSSGTVSTKVTTTNLPLPQLPDDFDQYTGDDLGDVPGDPTSYADEYIDPLGEDEDEEVGDEEDEGVEDEEDKPEPTPEPPPTKTTPTSSPPALVVETAIQQLGGEVEYSTDTPVHFSMLAKEATTGGVVPTTAPRKKAVAGSNKSGGTDG